MKSTNASGDLTRADNDVEQSLLSGPWEKIRQRVEPLLGDLESHFEGQQFRWQFVLDQLFTAEDLRVAAPVARDGNAPSNWVAVQPLAPRREDSHDFKTRYAPSFVEAIASLIDECRRLSMLPSSVSLDPSGEALELWSGPQQMFRISRMNLRAVSDAQRARSEGTVIGLRKFDDPEMELLRRVRRWPGLSGVVLKDNRHTEDRDRAVAFPSAAYPHHAVPKEWLLSVRALCARCGHPDPDRRFLEAVTAAVFDVPTWNHLASKWRGRASSAALGPWRVSFAKDSSSKEQDRGFYADGIDAVADLLARAPNEFMGGLPQAALMFSSRLGVPEYGLVQHDPAYHGPDSERGDAGWSVWVARLERMSAPEDGSVAAVKTALAQSTSAMLESLFA
ncbi:hypothetical protein [Variovorax paradoxus]|uniref:hypothetical protein n=1 Tax=Variovorax paradoxus TaxID=34073 RepID=UPI0027823C75|nr:hypothetical protein [Variovorax paradoxus]MDP9933479.1 hypothetical protein [Variovorax paradoxus]